MGEENRKNTTRSECRLFCLFAPLFSNWIQEKYVEIVSVPCRFVGLFFSIKNRIFSHFWVVISLAVHGIACFSCPSKHKRVKKRKKYSFCNWVAWNTEFPLEIAWLMLLTSWLIVWLFEQARVYCCFTAGVWIKHIFFNLVYWMRFWSMWNHLPSAVGYFQTHVNGPRDKSFTFLHRFRLEGSLTLT